MKIRHKVTGVVTEVIGFVLAHEYEIVRDPTVPVTSWQDVTGACEWTDHLYENSTGKRCMGDVGAISILCSWENGYRLRKVRVTEIRGEVLPTGTVHHNSMWAFLVERKVDA